MTEESSQVLPTSTWITKERLKPVIENIVKQDKVTIQDVKISPAVAAGENYVSILYRTEVKYKKGEEKDDEGINLIIKVPPVDEYLMKVVEIMGLIETEVIMYNKCLPLMYQIQKKYFLEDFNRFSPKSYPSNDGDVIIMEDLKELGYKMPERLEQNDYQHSLMLLKSLARYHALSLKIIENSPDWFEVVGKEPLIPENQVYADVYNPWLPLFVRHVKEWFGTEPWVHLLEKMSEKIYLKYCDVVKRKPDGFNVLCHGDLWSNNVMFKYDDLGRVQHAVMVDFQNCRYSTPALDLLSFFFTSVKVEVLCTKYFDLIEQYHKFLSNDLKILKLDQQHGLTLQELKEDLKQHACFPIVHTGTVLTAQLANLGDPVDVGDLKCNNAEADLDTHPLTRFYRLDRYKQFVSKTLLFMNDIGYIQAGYENSKHVI